MQDFDTVAEIVPEKPDRPERRVDLLLTDVLPASLARGSVERPYFNGMDTMRVDQFAHDLLRFREEVVLVREAGVIQTHTGIRLAADQPPDRLPGQFTEEVPEREIQRTESTYFSASGDLEIERMKCIAPEALDASKRLAQQRTSERMDCRGFHLVAWIGFAEAEHAGIGVQAHPVSSAARMAPCFDPATMLSQSS